MSDNPIPRGEGTAYDADAPDQEPDFEAPMSEENNPLPSEEDETP